MKRIRYRQGRWLPLLFMLVLCLLTTPIVITEARTVVKTTQLNATIFLLNADLHTLFQQNVDQQLPIIFEESIKTSTGSGPGWDWSQSIATALLDPSAKVTRVQPQQNGIVTSMEVKLYPEDPKPTTYDMLVTFSILNTTTVQVNAESTNNSPTLVEGPLTTFSIPMGRLQAITPVIDCGEAALAMDIQIDVEHSSDTAHSATSNQNSTMAIGNTGQVEKIGWQPGLMMANGHKQTANPYSIAGPGTRMRPVAQTASSEITTYIELPLSSIAALAKDMGTLPINSTLKAQNLRLSVKNGQFVLVSDISLWSTGLTVATATSYIEPQVNRDTLIFKVIKTDLSVLVFSFSGNSYNQQIEQTLNSNIGGAFGDDLKVKTAIIGDQSNVTCIATDSLVLSGLTTMG